MVWHLRVMGVEIGPVQTVPRRVNGELRRVNDEGRRVNDERRRVNGEHGCVNACDGRTSASTSRTPRQRSRMVAERRVVPATPTPARRSRRRASPYVSGLGCERRGMAVRASAPRGGENFATRASLLMSYRRTAFRVRANFAGCKSLIEELYHAEPGHIDPLLLAAEPTRRRSSAIRRRSLLDGLGNIVCCGSLPSRSRRAFFLPDVIRRQTDLTARIAEPPPATEASFSRAPDLLKVQLNDFIRRHDARLTLITAHDG